MEKDKLVNIQISSIGGIEPGTVEQIWDILKKGSNDDYELMVEQLLVMALCITHFASENGAFKLPVLEVIMAKILQNFDNLENNNWGKNGPFLPEA